MLSDGTKEELACHTWWSEHGPCVPQFLLEYLKGFLLPVGKMEGLGIVCAFSREGMFYERTPEADKRREYRELAEAMQEDPVFLEREQARWRRDRDSFLSGCGAPPGSADALAAWYDRIVAGYLELMALPLFIECIDVFGAEELVGLVGEGLPGIRRSEREKIFFTLSAMEQRSFMEEEELDFLRLVLDSETPMTIRDFRDHADTYHYVLNNFEREGDMSASSLLARARGLEREGKEKMRERAAALEGKPERVRKEKTALLEEHGIPESLLLHFRILTTAGSIIDERKAFMLRMVSVLARGIREIARISGIPYDDLLFYLAAEIGSLLREGRQVGKDILDGRRKNAVSISRRRDEGTVAEEVYYGSDAEEAFVLTSHKAGDLKGQVASSPVEELDGEVCIVLNVDRDPFAKGKILVTSMTRPEFLPLMRKAKAIITDEGGVTSHAAVIARELGIPCIIGTRAATSLLRDGDRVHMDLKEGTIRKLG